MRFRALRSPGLRLLAGGLLLVGLTAWLGGCGDDTLTSLGSPLRAHPDSLRSITLRHLAFYSVYAVPVSTGRSGVAQVGSRTPYRAHVLYDFRIPTRAIVGSETLHLDTATLNIHTDSMLTAPFTGSMRLRLQEVAVAGRVWALADSVGAPLNHLPELEPGLLARDVVLLGDSLANHAARFAFNLDLPAVAGYDSARAHGDTLDVNVALLFQGFDTSGQGFLRYTFVDAAGAQSSQLIGFASGEVNAMATVAPTRRRTVAEFDSTYVTHGKLVVSDGYRMHTYFKFPDMRTVFADTARSALIYSAELVLTQTDALDGVNFGASTDKIGIIVPSDTTISVYSKKTNTQTPPFTGSMTAEPGGSTTISLTKYILDQQEGRVSNRGMILVLPAEGTEVRHFEFYGTDAVDSSRLPALRIVYGFPAGFEGGHH
jgi:hypothetical protein